MILETRALEQLEVRGAEYPPPVERAVLAQLVSYAQMATYGFVFFMDSIFEALKTSPPPLCVSMKDNKIGTLMFVWFAGNIVQTGLLSTGAFEITHDGQLIWSSLKEKRLPNMEDLILAFEKTGVEFLPSSSTKR